MKTKRFILLVLLALCFSCSTDDNSLVPTQNEEEEEEQQQEDPTSVDVEKGVYALRDVDKLLDLEADWIRILVKDTDLIAIFNQLDAGIDLEDIPDAYELVQIHDAGVKIIVTVRWPDQASGEPELFDRVPMGQDRENSLEVVRRTLAEFGTYFDIFSVQNEVGGLGPGTYFEKDMVNTGNGSNAVNWWIDIVNTVNEEIAANPDLQHIALGSPVPIALKAMVFDPGSVPAVNQDFFFETIDFGNNYTDYLDFHFNRYTLDETDTALSYLAPLVQKPMISTEWSEVASAEGYMGLQNSDQLLDLAADLNYTITPGMTNEKLIHYMYTCPGPLELWEFMVAESGYVEGFIAQSALKLEQANFEILCWNGGPQAREPLFDLRKIYATSTVSGDDNTVSVFFNEFKEL